MGDATTYVLIPARKRVGILWLIPGEEQGRLG